MIFCNIFVVLCRIWNPFASGNFKNVQILFQNSSLPEISRRQELFINYFSEETYFSMWYFQSPWLSKLSNNRTVLCRYHFASSNERTCLKEKTLFSTKFKSQAESTSKAIQHFDLAEGRGHFEEKKVSSI